MITIHKQSGFLDKEKFYVVLTENGIAEEERLKIIKIVL